MMMVDLAAKLSQSHVESRNFLTFSMPSKALTEDKGELNSWLEAMMFLFEDIKWLLSMDVESFWNQIIYDESWPLCFDSFLQKAPRLYDLENISDSCKVPLNKVGRLFLLAIKRMSLNKEDENKSFSEKNFGELIYESYLFDAAKLLDIASIFYKEDDNNLCTLIEEIYENIFKCQPNYFEDMSHAVNCMMDTLTSIEERLVVTTNVMQSEKDEKVKISGKEAQDILMFLYDMAKTLQIFINAFPKCSQVFFKSIVVSKLASFTEHSLMSILALIEIDRKKFKYVCSEIKKSFIKFVSMIITYGFIKRDQSTIGEDEDLSGEFVTSIDAIGQCPQFLSGYYALGNIDSDFQVIEKLGLLDHASLDYAKNMLGAVAIETDSDKVRKELMDILPGQNPAFIDKCIETYGPKVDVIMNNIMEGNIVDETIVPPTEKKPLDIPNKEVLRDDKHVALLKATLFEAEDADEQSYDLYDDEYDDTYDSHNIGANDVDDWEEFTARRKFTIPAALRQIGDVSSESEEDENDEEDEGENEGKSAEGERDPAAPAADGNRNESNRGGNRGGRGRGRGGHGRGGRGRGGSNPPGNSNANQGNGRGGNNRGGGGPRGGGPRGGGPRGGRGNSRGGHHNHRRLADKKRSQGMMPY